VFKGMGKFCNASEPLAVPTEPTQWADATPPPRPDRTLALFDRGGDVEVQASDEGIRPTDLRVG
jgi:hypothetical protein